MACNCGKRRIRYEVVSKDGKILHRNLTQKHLAEKITDRYPGSRVREIKPPEKATAKRSTTEAPSPRKPH